MIVDGRHRYFRQRFQFQIGRPQIGEAHKILGVVIAAAGQHRVQPPQAQAPGEIVAQIFRHLAVIDKTHRVRLAAAFEAALHPFKETLGNLLPQLQLRVAGKLDGIGLNAFEMKNSAKYIMQTDPDQVFQRHHHLGPLAFARRNTDKTIQAVGGHFQNGIAHLIGRHYLDRQVDRRIIQLRQRVVVVQNNGHQLGLDVLKKVVANKLDLVLVQLSLTYQINPALAQVFQGGQVNLVEAVL